MRGNQTPRFANFPAYGWTHAEDAAFLSAGYGLVPDPWQFDVLRGWLGVDRAGRWTAGRCGLAVPRQNGKNAVAEIMELYKMVTLARKVLHTAHEVKTARKAFIRLCSFFENRRQWPELEALVKEIRRTNGQEAIFLTNGGSVEFVARTRSSGRGFTVDDLVIDEAQELTDDQLDALQSTISAAPSGDPQTVYIGTPPGPNAPGEVWERVRQSGISGLDKRLAYFEWSPRVSWRITLRPKPMTDDDWQQIADSNPALGYRLLESTIEDERNSMSDDGFARERGGQWAERGPARVVPIVDADAWAKLIEPGPPTRGAKVYGVKFSPDGRLVALAVALRPERDPIHVEGIQRQPMSAGLGWLTEWLVARADDAAAIVIDGRAGAGALERALRQRKVPERRILRPTVDQVITAHSAFLTAIIDEDLTHYGDPVLTGAVTSAGRRAIGANGGWGFDGDPLSEAAALAYFGATRAKVTSTRGSGSSRRALVA